MMRISMQAVLLILHSQQLKSSKTGTFSGKRWFGSSNGSIFICKNDPGTDDNSDDPLLRGANSRTLCFTNSRSPSLHAMINFAFFQELSLILFSAQKLLLVKSWSLNSAWRLWAFPILLYLWKMNSRRGNETFLGSEVCKKWISSLFRASSLARVSEMASD